MPSVFSGEVGTGSPSGNTQERMARTVPRLKRRPNGTGARVASWPGVLLLGVALAGCAGGEQVSTDRHSFTGTVHRDAGALNLKMTTPDGFSCVGAAQAQAATMIVGCSNGLSAEFIGIDNPAFFDEPVVFRLNNGAIGTARLQVD